MKPYMYRLQLYKESKASADLFPLGVLLGLTIPLLVCLFVH